MIFGDSNYGDGESRGGGEYDGFDDGTLRLSSRSVSVNGGPGRRIKRLSQIPRKGVGLSAGVRGGGKYHRNGLLFGRGLTARSGGPTRPGRFDYPLL